MEATLRLMAWLERAAPAAALAAGVPFFLMWQLRAWDRQLPVAVVALVHLSAFVLVSTAVVGLQLGQGTHPSGWIGWGGAGAVVTGAATSFPLLCLGLLAFGVAIARCRIHRPESGHLMAAGGAVLLLVFLNSPGFGTEVAMATPGRLAMGAGALMVAGALVDLGLAAREQREVSAGSVRA